MVLIAIEMPVDLNANVNSGGVCSAPNAIVRTLTQDEMERHLGLYSGSGGITSAFFNTAISGSDNILIETQATSAISLSATLDFISATFALNKTELATVCNVQSRKTLYNWIDGSVEPHSENTNRIFNLYVISQGWQEQGFSFDKALLKQPIIDNNSVIDLLSQDNLNQETIMFAGSRLELTSGTSKQLEDPFT